MNDAPVFDFRVCTPRPGRVRGRSGFDLHVDRGLEAAADADLVCLAPKQDFATHEEELLECSSLPVEQIAARVGFGNAATLRQHFARVRGVSPQQYRRQFAC